MKKNSLIKLLTINTLLFTLSLLNAQEYQTIFPAHMMVKIPCVNNNTKLMNDQTTLGSLHYNSAYCGGRLVLALNQSNELKPLVSFPPNLQESEFFVSIRIDENNLYCTHITPQIKKVLENQERYGYTPESLGAALLKADQKALSDAQLPMFNNIITQIPVPYAVQVPTPVYVQVPGPTILIPQPVHVPVPAPLENKMTPSDQQITNTQPVSLSEQPQHIDSSTLETNTKNKEERKKRKKEKEAAAKEAATQVEITNFIVQMFNEPINAARVENKTNSLKDQTHTKLMSKPMTESQIKEQDAKELAMAAYKKQSENDNDDEITIEKPNNTKSKKEKRKKKKKNSINGNVNDNDDDDFEEKFSKDEVAQLIADTMTYHIITQNIATGVEFNPENLPKLMNQVNRFFNYARKSNDPEIIKLLDTIFKESLIAHAQTGFPEIKPINFCYSSGLLYALYIIDTLNRKKDTLSVDETLKLLYEFETYQILQYMLVHQKDEYSGESLITTINGHHTNLIKNAHKKSLLQGYKKELCQLNIEQEYINQYLKEIAHCALQCLPHIIENSLPAIIGELTLIPRSQEANYKECSSQLEELICNIITLINCISREYTTEAEHLKSTVQKIIHKHKVLTITIKDYAFDHIDNFINGTTLPVKKPTNNKELNNLFLKHFTERLDGQPILNLLNDLKCGVYGDPLNLLENIETAVPLNTLFSLPEMTYSRKILITALLLKYDNNFEKRRYLDYLETITEKFHKKTLENLKKNLADK